MLNVQGGQSSGLIATPEIALEGATPGLEFIILASDGLWDVVDDQVRGSHKTFPGKYASWRGEGVRKSAWLISTDCSTTIAELCYFGV